MIVSAFINSLIEVGYLLGTIIGVGLLLGILEKKSNAYVQQSFGRKAILLTAWIGTPIHELGHLIQCWIWRHKVTEVKFLQLHDQNGVLGYVNHAWNPKNPYQRVGNFFIGLGPIFSGIAALIGAMYVFVPGAYEIFRETIHNVNVYESQMTIEALSHVGQSMFLIAKALFSIDNLVKPGFWIFLLVALCISSHIALSPADIKGSWSGLIAIFFLVFLFNILSIVLDVEAINVIKHIAVYNAYVIAFSSVALLFSFITFVLSFILAKLR